VRAVEGAKRRGLFTTKPFSKGEVILREAPLLWQLGGGGDTTATSSSSSSPFLAPFHTPDEVDGILYQLSPFFGAVGQAEAEGGSEGVGAGASPQLPPALARADLATRVMKENSFGVGSVAAGGSEAVMGVFARGGQGRALYPGVAMANHSCHPCARALQEGGAKELDEDATPPRRVLEARRDIGAGEEVTIAYIPVTWMQRRRGEALKDTWGFACACARCTAPHDDTVALKCSACGQGRVWGGATSCGDCGAASAVGQGVSVVSGEVIRGGDDALLQALCAPGRPRELICRILQHPTHCTEDIRLFLTAMNLLEALAPAPALRDELKLAMAKACGRMGYVDASEMGLE